MKSVQAITPPMPAAPFRSSNYSDGIDVPGMSLRKVVALLELAKGAS